MAFEHTAKAFDDDLQELNLWGPRMLRKLQALPLLTDVSSDQQDRVAPLGQYLFDAEPVDAFTGARRLGEWQCRKAGQNAVVIGGGQPHDVEHQRRRVVLPASLKRGLGKPLRRRLGAGVLAQDRGDPGRRQHAVNPVAGQQQPVMFSKFDGRVIEPQFGFDPQRPDQNMAQGAGHDFSIGMLIDRGETHALHGREIPAGQNIAAGFAFVSIFWLNSALVICLTPRNHRVCAG